jgi:hypothetical protein
MRSFVAIAMTAALMSSSAIAARDFFRRHPQNAPGTDDDPMRS